MADWGVRLADLHDQLGYRALRFDRGQPFAGRVAVLPSAFNPPTRAHQGLLEVAREAAGTSAVAALLTTNNVDKSLFGAPLAHRVGMLLALSAAGPALGPPVAVLASNAARIADQGAALIAAFPDVEFDFVVGFDTLVRLFEPRYYEDMDDALRRFFSRHRVVATNRAEATADSIRDFLSEPVARPYADRVIVAELDRARAGMSSTAAREAVAEGLTLPEALAPPVHEYISQHGLYGAGPAGAAD